MDAPITTAPAPRHRRPAGLAAVGGTALALAAGLPAAADVSFAPFTSYPVGEATSGATSADFDGDGDLDVAVSNRNTDDVRLLWNDGSGVLTVGASVPTTAIPRYVESADLDGDGDVDLVAAGSGAGVAILRNLGDGTFAPFELIPVDEEQAWFALLDVDVDGDTDLAVCTEGVPSELLLFHNDGTGAFTEVQRFIPGDWVRGGSVADLNADGRPDLVTANLLGSSISVMLAGADGLLDDTPDLTFGPSRPRYTAAADLDGDGDVDVAVVDKANATVRFYRNDGTGDLSWTSDDILPIGPNPHGIVAADFDLDGDVDLAACTIGQDADSFGLDVLENVGLGVFAVRSLPVPTSAAHVIAADLDADGLEDLVIARAVTSGAAVVLLNDSDDATATCPPDLDGSGAIDFADLVAMLATWGPCAACDGDLDGDGTVGFTDLLELIAGWGPC